MIYGKISGQRLTITQPVIASDTIAYLSARFEFSAEWSGRAIYAHFLRSECGDDPQHYMFQLDTNNEIKESEQINLGAGVWTVYLVGYTYAEGDVESRVTTTSAVVEVYPTGNLDGEITPPLPPSIAEQLMAKIGDLNSLSTEDRDNLVAAINEAANEVQIGGLFPAPHVKLWVDEDDPDYVVTKSYVDDALTDKADIGTVAVSSFHAAHTEYGGRNLGDLTPADAEAWTDYLTALEAALDASVTGTVTVPWSASGFAVVAVADEDGIRAFSVEDEAIKLYDYSTGWRTIRMDQLLGIATNTEVQVGGEAPELGIKLWVDTSEDGIPEPTAADNGKLLGVVDGHYALVER